MTLLALDAGVRETGWAVFQPDRMNVTGAIKVSRSRSLDGPGRVAHLVRCLDQLVARWQPKAVAYCQPTGIRWPAPTLELLDRALADWSGRHHLPLYTYSAQEVRNAIARHSHVSQEQLAYLVMLRLGLVGESKSTQEWEALAVGYYHLCRWRQAA